MAFDAPINDKAKENFDLLYDVQIWLGIVAILPLLQSIHCLIKNLDRCGIYLSTTLWLQQKYAKGRFMNFKHI